MTHSEKVLEEMEKDTDSDVRLADQLEREGSIAYQNAVLEEMEKKHHSEQEVGCARFFLKTLNIKTYSQFNISLTLS